MDDRKGEPPVTRGVAQFAVKTIVAVVVVAFALLLYYLHDLLLLVFGAVLVAVILNAAADGLGRIMPMPRWAHLLIAALLIFALIGGVIFIFGATVSAQTGELIARLPGAVDDLRDLVGEERVNQVIRSFTPNSGDVLTVVRTVFGIASGILSGLLLAILGGVYLAVDPDQYRRGFVHLFPHGSRPALTDGLAAAGRSLRNWLLGMLASMLGVGVVTFIGLSIVGVPSPLALALIAGLLEFVPIVGPFLSAVPAVLIALTVSGETALLTVGLYLLIQQFEGNLLQPLVMKHVVDLPPAMTLFGLFLMGGLFGPVGIVLGGPLIVVVFVLVKTVWVERTLGDEMRTEA